MNDQNLEKEKQNKPKLEWEKREFAITNKMKEVCQLGITAAQAEIESLKRKLKKLQYGS
jgi:hypothetical protein